MRSAMKINVNFMLSYVCRPAPSIIWKKNDQKITSKQQTDLGISLSFQDRLLTIDNVDKSKHQDTYTCEAENTQNSGSPITTRTQLRVLGN